MSTIKRSELLEWAHHEHEHLTRLFDDLRATFNKIATGELEGAARDEALDQGVEDLEAALEDMLEHFNEEEEIYFLAIEARFPEYAPKIEALTATHQLICERTQRLQRQIAQQREMIHEISVELIAHINALTLELERHNEQVQQVFMQALRRLPEDERIELLASKKSLG